jgi:ATP-dependent RNA helicase MSS116, mitochondrial
MFQASLKRQALLGAVARRQFSLSATSRSSALIRQAVSSSSSTSNRLVTTPRASLVRQFSPRFYSSEAAESTSSPALRESSELITKFEDLTRLGVDPVLVEALTVGMKYSDMTEVQSMTINSALKGVDL